MTIYDPSDLVPLRVYTRNTAGALATTTSVMLTLTDPAGAEAAAVAMTETEPGTWDYDAPAGAAGVHVWRAVAAGAVTGEFGGWWVTRARRTPGPEWTPDLDAVADWIPARTLSSITTPGEELYLGTFTDTTTPTDEQVSRQIIAAVAYVRSQAGATIDPGLYDDARAAAACVAAAYVELAYPMRQPDLSTYDRLWAQAQTLVSALADSNTATTGGAVSLEQSLLPQWSYPDPVPWGDDLIP